MNLLDLQKKRHFRMISVLAALCVCGLMLGAGHLEDSLLSYRQTVENRRHEWETAVRCLLSGNAAIGRDTAKPTLQNMASAHPELLLQAFYSEIKPEGTGN